MTWSIGRYAALAARGSRTVHLQNHENGNLSLCGLPLGDRAPLGDPPSALPSGQHWCARCAEGAAERGLLVEGAMA